MPATSKSQKDLVRDHFNVTAVDWQSIYSAGDVSSRIIQERAEKVLAHVDAMSLPAGATVLDLGCGAGLMARELLRRGMRVTGVDAAESMVELARKNCAEFADRAEFRMGDAERLDFKDGTFDLVVAMGLIQYLEWDRWTLQEMHRVLKPGGHLIVTVPNLARLAHLDPLYLAVQVKKRITKSRALKPGRPAYYDRYYRIGRLRRTLESLGFDVRDAYSHGFGPFWSLERFGGLSLAVNRFFSGLRRFVPFLGGMGSNYVLLCEARPSVFGLEAGRDFPDPEDHRRNLERERHRYVRIRDQWLDAHPQFRGQPAEPLHIEEANGAGVLVLAPHPDDEIIGCGGTLVKMVRAGARVTVLYATNGARSAALARMPEEQRRTVRFDHARAVGKAAGFHAQRFWDQSEGFDPMQPGLVEELARLLDDVKPRFVFTPFAADAHPDHRSVNIVLTQALERARDAASIAVLGYEVWSLAPHSRYCDITDVMKTKERLLLMYWTEMMVDDYVHTSEALQFYNARRLTGRNGFVEGFFALDGAAMAALCRRDFGIPAGPDLARR